MPVCTGRSHENKIERIDGYDWDKILKRYISAMCRFVLVATLFTSLYMHFMCGAMHETCTTRNFIAASTLAYQHKNIAHNRRERQLHKHQPCNARRYINIKSYGKAPTSFPINCSIAENCPSSAQSVMILSPQPQIFYRP